MHGRWYFDRGHTCVYLSLKPFGIFGRQFIESVYIFPETLWIWRCPLFESPYLYTYFPETLRIILETPIHWNPLKALVNKGTLYSLKLWIPWTFCYLWNIWALHTSYYIHINRLTPARSCVMLGYPEAWGRGEGTPYPLNLWSPLVFGSAESIKAGNGSSPPLKHWGQNCIVLGHPEAWGSGLGCG